VLRELRIGALELRSVWETNVLELDDRHVETVRLSCAASGVEVVCLGSPIGKAPLTESPSLERTQLERALEVARSLGSRRIRLFSFYPSSGRAPDDCLTEAAGRLRTLASMAGQAGVLLMVENEHDLVGDQPERIEHLLAAVDSPHLRFVWDCSNFVRAGLERPVDRAWPLLNRFLAHVQIKDSRSADGTIVPAGEGEAQVGLLLERLRSSGYSGYLALEPHLAYAGPRGGFSGPDGMARAVAALRALLATHGYPELLAPAGE
jgi:sugar phosphate isomerase/epimerase